MFARLFNKQLRLDVGQRKLSFPSLVDFEFNLASRTEVPASKVAELVKLPADALMREATKIHKAEKRFVNVLAGSLEEPGSVDRRMQELGHKVFSQDHEWRAIIAALNTKDKAFAEFKKLALVKYLQYLGSRQEILKSIYADKIAHGANEEPEGAAEAMHKETVIFDLPNAGDLRNDTSQFERLPKGETVAIRFLDGRELEIMLSRNRFKLVSGESFSFIDEHGSDHALESGRNRVGRDAKNEIIIDSSFRDVSRCHLIIEPFSPDTALFTDLSSHGTYVPIRCIAPGLSPN